MTTDYRPLWDYVRKNKRFPLTLTFAQIQEITGCPLQHSFLNEKKKLLEYGYSVIKISMKDKYVVFDVSD